MCRRKETKINWEMEAILPMGRRNSLRNIGRWSVSPARRKDIVQISFPIISRQEKKQLE